MGVSIINTGSTASFTAVPDTVSYIATKHAILGIAKSTALDYAYAGIRCNALCPGNFEWPLTHLLAEEPDPVRARRELAACYPTNRILQPEDVATAAVCRPPTTPAE